MKRVAATTLLALCVVSGVACTGPEPAGPEYTPTQEELDEWIRNRDAGIELCAPRQPILTKDGFECI